MKQLIDGLRNIIFCKKLMRTGKQLEKRLYTLNQFPNISNDLELSEILTSWLCPVPNKMNILSYRIGEKTENENPLSAYGFFAKRREMYGDGVHGNPEKDFDQIWVGIGQQTNIPKDYIIMGNGQIALSWFIPLLRIW